MYVEKKKANVDNIAKDIMPCPGPVIRLGPPLSGG